MVTATMRDVLEKPKHYPPPTNHGNLQVVDLSNLMQVTIDNQLPQHSSLLATRKSAWSDGDRVWTDGIKACFTAV